MQHYSGLLAVVAVELILAPHPVVLVVVQDLRYQVGGLEHLQGTLIQPQEVVMQFKILVLVLEEQEVLVQIELVMVVLV
jgi:hypothetical protein